MIEEPLVEINFLSFYLLCSNKQKQQFPHIWYMYTMHMNIENIHVL